jgi:diguanylate cyclase (GGDEF)-like protein/PAS domain S-box-containing protein
MKNMNNTHENTIYGLDELHKLLRQLKTSASKDISAERIIDGYLNLILTISNITSRLIKFDNFNNAIDDSLQDLGEVTHASRAYLFLLRDDGYKMDNTHEWCADGVSPQIDNLQDLSTEIFPWWMEKLQKKETIHITDVHQMPPEARAEREMLEQQDIKSLLALPIFIKDHLAGFIGFDNVLGSGRWPDSTILLLRFVSESIGNAIEHARVEQQLIIHDHAIESSVNAIAFADLDGKITYVNKSFVKMWGYKDEHEVIGKSNLTFWRSEEEAKKVVNILREKGYWIGELVAMRSDNSTFDVQLSASTVKDSNGKPLCMMASFMDITVQKQAETALRDSEEKFSRIFHNVTDAITVTNLDGIIIEVNERTVELHGYESKAEVLGKNAFELIAPSDHEKARLNMEKTFKQGSIKGLEYMLVRKDGSEFAGELNASLLKDSANNPIGYVAITRDITERKQTEQELRRFATIDALTGVYNRRTGLLLFAQQLRFAKRNNQKLCLCYIDTDFLKNINDIYGHAEGDEALKNVSTILKAAVRKIDIVCRIGGDEFIVILPQCTMKQAGYIWDRIDKKVQSFNAKNTKPYSISLSRGFSEYDPEFDTSSEQLIQIADKEMYIHKRTKFRE